MEKVLIIAEAGVNHNGSLKLAKEMALQAKLAGADIVKYQTCIPELVVSKFAEKAQYQKDLTGSQESQLEMVKRIHFDFNSHKELKKYCDEIGIIYLSAAFDLPSIDFLDTLDMPYHKIPSGEITNLLYLEKIAKSDKNLILSTGMCEMQEIETAIKILKKYKDKEIIILHCNTQYPTPNCDANLLAINTLKSFGCKVGFSDHTKGILADVMAVSLGVSVIEKHFTLDKNMDGPDHKASLDVKELKELCIAIREAEILLGSGIKKVSNSEKANKAIARKSIVALKNIKKGEVFSEENLTIKRPGTGISPMNWYDILGKVAKYDFEEDECIRI